MADDRPRLRKKAPYKEVKRPEHPLARSDGFVLEHRATLYDAIGLGPHPCEYCGKPLNWYARVSSPQRPLDYLVVDHKDAWTLNGDLSNLAVSCGPCNNSRGCKNQKLADELYRVVLPKPVPKSRYKRLKRRGHPLATASGHLCEHRAVLYDKLGPGTHPCHWCGKLLRWTIGKLEKDSILPDHINFSERDNRPANIVAACAQCNARRQRRRVLKDGEFMASYPSGMRFRAVWENCGWCGKKFAKKVSEKNPTVGKFCSHSCSTKSKAEARYVLGPEEIWIDGSNGKRMRAKMVRCLRCGKEYPRATYLPPETKLCCSRECSDNLRRKPNISTCGSCGKEFSILPNRPRKFCSLKCAARLRPSKKIQTSCAQCGKGYTALTCQHSKFCSRECFGDSMRIRPAIVCAQCCKQFRPKPSLKRIFCSRKCRADSQRTTARSTCAECGKQFLCPPHMKRTYCSRECYYAHRSAGHGPKTGSLFEQSG